MGIPENSSEEGLQPTDKVFQYPKNLSSLDSATKRKMTICNLYANHRLSISDIVRLLDEKQAHVISVLIEQGLIVERRKHPRPVKQERRGSLLKYRLDREK